jgi:hypothetical protein
MRLPAAERKNAKGPALATPTEITPRIPSHNTPDGDVLVSRFLRALQVQMRSIGLYQRNHPQVTESLESAERHLRAVFLRYPTFGVQVEQGTLFLTTRLLTAPASARDSAGGRALPDPHGELRALAEQLAGAGVISLVFSSQTNLGELAAFAEAVDATCRVRKHKMQPGTDSAPRDWSTWLSAHDVTGIRVNVSLERRHDAVLASLMGALLERETANPSGSQDGIGRITDSTGEQVRRTLHFSMLAGQHLDQAQHDSPQDAARAVQAELAGADPQILGLVMKCAVANPPLEGDAPGLYLSRIADGLASEFVGSEYASRRIGASEIRTLFKQLYRNEERGATQDPAIELRIERFWAGLPAREIARTLASGDAWCVPVSLLRRHLEPLIVATEMKNAQAAGREARLALSNFVRCLESEEERARRTVAAALVELSELLARLWPHPQLQDLAPTVVTALVRETSPGIAGLRVAATENLARLGLARRGYAEVECILEDLDKAPRDADHAHMAALARRIVAQESWLSLVDEALANRPLDAALPRLLRREPQRLLDRLGLLLTAPEGANSMPAMARLVRAAGEPVLGTLEVQLSEPRRQGVATAIKLLAAVQPQRLAAALPRVMPSWDWSLQDLAVSELSRQHSPALRMQASQAFLKTMTEVHSLVVPGMLDQVALAGEESAVPQLWEIAAGDVERLRDIFIRIKAVEALGRLRATAAADLLRNMVRQRSGLTYVEPAGLRAAAEDALALIENHPASARLRAQQEEISKSSGAFSLPRRYLRVDVPAALSAKIATPHEGMAKVRSISMGGMLLETATRLNVGDSIRVEIRAGLRRIASTAVVRHASMAGYGVEFMHMKPDDREKLRKYISKLLR